MSLVSPSRKGTCGVLICRYVEVSNPKLVVILGCFGLASNIVGLFLFHGTSFSVYQLSRSTMVPGRVTHPPFTDHGDSNGHSHGHGGHDHAHSLSTQRQKKPSPHQSSEVEPLLIDASSPVGTPIGNGTGRRARSRSPSVSSRFGGHPVQTRAAVVATAQSLASPPPTTMSPLAHRRSSSSARGRPAPSHSGHSSTHITPGDMEDITEVNSSAATPHARGRSISPDEYTNGHAHEYDNEHEQDYDPFKHAHPTDLEAGKPKNRHNHGSMNMRALVLHVMGDALGNVGVIGSGLVIWLTTWQYRYYSDPIISLIITCIIFSSALPLVKSASFILLQGVPESVNLEDVREDISAVDGVVSIHELHVWQLSESKHVASVHILLRKKEDFMRVVRDIRRVLHEHDIHNGSIQPEFGKVGDNETEYASPSMNCLVTCPPGLCEDQSCCRQSTIFPLTCDLALTDFSANTPPQSAPARSS